MARVNEHIRRPERGAPALTVMGPPEGAIPVDGAIPEGWHLARKLPNISRYERTRAGLALTVIEYGSGEVYWRVEYGMGPAVGIDDLAGVEMYARGQVQTLELAVALANDVADRLRERGAIPLVRS